MGPFAVQGPAGLPGAGLKQQVDAMVPVSLQPPAFLLLSLANKP